MKTVFVVTMEKDEDNSIVDVVGVFDTLEKDDAVAEEITNTKGFGASVLEMEVL